MDKKYKQGAKAIEKMQVDHGRRIAEIYDDLEENQAKLRKAMGESPLI